MRISNAVNTALCTGSVPSFSSQRNSLPALLRLLDLLFTLLLALLRLRVCFRDSLASLPLLLASLDSHDQVVSAASLGRFGNRALGLGPVICCGTNFVPVDCVSKMCLKY